MLSNYASHTTLPATDMERAKKFYGETLGFSGDEQPGGVFYQSGNTRFLVYPTGGTASGAHTQIGWVVDDVESVVSDLKGRGVAFEEYDTPHMKTENSVATIGNIRAAWFKDSEGNLLGVVQLP